MINGGWQSFQRTGTVLAVQRDRPWTWVTHSGLTLRGEAGDWEVRESEDDEPWSVREDIFRSSYEHLEGRRWRRRGVVLARPARDGEVIETLEGAATAHAGDWVVRGDAGECWPVRAPEFAKRYRPVDGAPPGDTGAP
ncbi:hypothetical protein MCHIJ_46560 [Mycolicibacterium chitae]|uniref:RyR domain protein n=1 Tax=Mycolicibacterium chitae TaxID=1792 RepID=A0A3S4VCX6_MYCCI|nr:hypothetical protein [Mycolicibacterium chitae]BBZ05219.1 hypothetical protein MCHIJ_46560 [Mycolicibacterium chitae]VEG48838.1 RyR domain protein [Mycolicibacterium chitae]